MKCVSCHFLSVVIVSPNRLAFDLMLQEHYLLTHFGLHKVDFMKPFVKHQVKKKTESICS